MMSEYAREIAAKLIAEIENDPEGFNMSFWDRCVVGKFMRWTVPGWAAGDYCFGFSSEVATKRLGAALGIRTELANHLARCTGFAAFYFLTFIVEGEERLICHEQLEYMNKLATRSGLDVYDAIYYWRTGE